MIICRVIGHVWATKKDEDLEGLKLMIVQEEENGLKTKAIHVAADVACAGVGDQVLVVTGSTARKVFGDSCPVDMAIVGVIDDIEIDEKQRI